jgi:plastocyanin
MARIGFLRQGPRESAADPVQAFVDGLGELGYIAGESSDIEWRFAPDGDQARLDRYAIELVSFPLEAIVTMTTPSASAAAGLSAAGATATVTMLGDRYDRSSITVPVGSTVRWTNASVNVHTVTAMVGSLDRAAVSPGESTSVTFDRSGTYRYYCRQHILGGMLGTVIVE